MQDWLEKYRVYITGGLIIFIAIGGLALMYEQQRDKIISAQNSLKVEKADWQREKDEMTGQMEVLQKQIGEVQKQKMTGQAIPTGQVAGASTTNPATISGLINLNSADASVFDSLPGIGPAKAQAIIEYRDSHGGFKNISELKNVKGIGDATFDKLKSKITI